MNNEAQIRYNPLNGRSVIFAPKRSKRPNDLKNKTNEKICPFCPQNINKKTLFNKFLQKINRKVLL